MTSDWYRKYKLIEDSKVDSFVKEGLADACEFLCKDGKPLVPVKTVYIRQSRLIVPEPGVREGFQLTECVDADQGVFTIYLCWEPSDYSFFGQLAHEIAHLLNANLCDCYVEGVNTVFAEHFLHKKGLDWEGWRTHFNKGSDPFYAQTYFMMKDILEKVGNKNIKNLLSFAVTSNADNGRMQINIDGWLLTLSGEQRKMTRESIGKYSPRIASAISQDNRSEAFNLPKGE